MNLPIPTDTPLSFPERLRIERKRLGLSQERFGRLGGVSKTAQWLYEAGKNWPTVEYLEALKDNRVDVGFMVTGNRLPTDRLDWTILRNAFLFVQHSLANRPDRNFTHEQLFDTFRNVVEAAMGNTRHDLAGCNKEYAFQSIEGIADER